MRRYRFILFPSVLFAALVLPGASFAQKPKPAQQDCRSVSFEGEVKAGQPFRKVFAPGLEFFLEPLASGWIVRVLEMQGGREIRVSHDWAEVATPPYKSVSPLLISTDWAFRAQDAGAWNPREFRFVTDAKVFVRLSALEERVIAGDRSAESEAAALIVGQPEARLVLENVTLVPGIRNQSGLAASVASHWAKTPHQVVQGEASTPLGRLASLAFRVTMDLPSGISPATGMPVQRFSCTLRPTG